MADSVKAKSDGTDTVSGDAYPLDVCVVSGEKLGEMGKPFVLDYQGREIRLCCRGYVGKFEADSATYLKKLDAAIVKQQAPLYPLNKCVVSGETLGEMGDPVDYVTNNRLVRLCCKGCVNKIEKDQASYMQKLDSAVRAEQLENYPLDTCVISGEKLGGPMGSPVDFVQGNRLFRLCCKNCVKSIQKDPVKAQAALDKAYVAAQLDGYPLSVCPVSGEKLGAMSEPVDYLYGNHLVRFCCSGCVKKFEADPASYLKKMTAEASMKHEGHE